MHKPTEPKGEPDIFASANHTGNTIPSPTNAIKNHLGTLGLAGGEVNIPLEEELLAYDPEKQPPLGVVSYREFEEFAEENGVTKAMATRTWGAFTELSTRLWYARAAWPEAEGLKEEHQATASRYELIKNDQISTEEFTAAEIKAEEVQRRARQLDAELREVDSNYGNAALLLGLQAPEASDVPFAFKDAACTEPFKNGLNGNSEIAAMKRSSYIDVTPMYAAYVKSRENDDMVNRGLQGAVVTPIVVRFLNSHIERLPQEA